MTREEIARQVLKELKNQRDAYRKAGDILSYDIMKEVVHIFQDWMRKNLNASCPVNLGEYALKTPGWETLMAPAGETLLASEESAGEETREPPQKKPPAETSTPALLVSASEDWAHQIERVRSWLEEGNFERILERVPELLAQKPPLAIQDELRKWLWQARQNARSQWMRSALEAMEQDDWKRADALIMRILQEFPGDEDANVLKQRVNEAIARATFRKELQTWLQKAQKVLSEVDIIDIKVLGDMVREGDPLRERLSHYPDLTDDERVRSFEQTLAQIRQYYDERRRKQAQRTTAEVLQHYEGVVDAIKELEEALRAGQKYWFDERIGGERPIEDLLADYRNRLPELAREVAERHWVKAQEYLSLHKPEEAWKEVQEGLHLKDLPADMRKELESFEIQVKAEKEKKERAKQLLDRAMVTEDPRDVWIYLQEAEQTYPYHEDLPEVRAILRNRMRIWMDHRLRNLREAVFEALHREDFIQARTVVEQFQTEVLSFLSEEEARPWLVQLLPLLQEVDKAERRRRDIDNWIEYIRELMRKEHFNEAWRHFRLMREEHPDWEEDAKVLRVYEDLQLKMGDQQRLEEARRLYMRGRFEEAMEVLNLVYDEAFLEEVRRLRGDILVAEAQARIRRFYELHKYRDIERYYEQIVRDPGLSQEHREALSEWIAPYLNEITELRQNDTLIFTRLQEFGIPDEDALLSLHKQIREWQRDRSALEHGWRIYQLLKELGEQPSTLQGYLREAREWMAQWLRQSVPELLQLWVERGRWEDVRAWLERWEQEWPFYEREWLEKMYLTLYQHETEQARQTGDWARVEKIWDEAYKTFKYYRFLQEKERARRYALLHKLRETLFQNAPDPQMRPVLEELQRYRAQDPEVHFALELAEHLRRLHDLWETRQIQGMTELVAEARTYLPALLSQLNDHAVVFRADDVDVLFTQRLQQWYWLLMKEGDQAQANGDALSALIAYGQAALLPFEQTLKGELNAYIKPLQEKGEQILVSFLRTLLTWQYQAELPLCSQLQELEALRYQIRFVKDVLGIFMPPTWRNEDREDLIRKLDESDSVLKHVFEWLSEAQRLITLYHPDHPGSQWPQIVRTQAWKKVENAIKKLEKQRRTEKLPIALRVPDLPLELRELQQRISSLDKDMAKLEDQRERLKKAWMEEEFSMVLKTLKEMRQTVEEAIARWNGAEAEYLSTWLQEEIRVFHENPVKGIDAVEQLARDLHENQSAWLSWSEQVKNAKQRWASVHQHYQIQDRLSSGKETPQNAPILPGHDVNQQVALRFDEFAKRLEQEISRIESMCPRFPPATQKARNAKREGEELLALLLKFMSDFREAHKRYYYSLDQIIAKAQSLIAQGQYDAAQKWIISAYTYYGRHPFLQRLQHLIEELTNPPSPPFWKRWLRR